MRFCELFPDEPLVKNSPPCEIKITISQVLDFETLKIFHTRNRNQRTHANHNKRIDAIFLVSLPTNTQILVWLSNSMSSQNLEQKN